MGTFMAAALGKLFRENEHLVQMATAVVAMLENAETFSEQVLDVSGAVDASGVRPASFQWRASFRTLDDLRDFDAAITEIMATVLEK